jgi:hypothetical protein
MCRTLLTDRILHKEALYQILMASIGATAELATLEGDDECVRSVMNAVCRVETVLTVRNKATRAYNPDIFFAICRLIFRSKS